ncbi:hypothetical protein ASPZODRAFT_130444 [Penicilliopsis zonata CBS 506.65]|uniref:Uncharacterized protein n=1 Tax=Penicilliopsis zonata CBS 506.65 TaxID=1073090 RepID=A0A1L9SMD1_9EURO|nr:hypothetical protein ASPZODRAFT_130444 [Penicilliopsis zonata CBS 506.65]OJJ48419.1 hypothetical protein ASPZODRAFT_130444 [Penicilliopsis zonata CBS 506.65]
MFNISSLLVPLFPTACLLLSSLFVTIYYGPWIRRCFQIKQRNKHDETGPEQLSLRESSSAPHNIFELETLPSETDLSLTLNMDLPFPFEWSEEEENDDDNEEGEEDLPKPTYNPLNISESEPEEQLYHISDLSSSSYSVPRRSELLKKYFGDDYRRVLSKEELLMQTTKERSVEGDGASESDGDKIRGWMEAVVDFAVGWFQSQR